MMKRLGIHILAFNETKLDNSFPKELTKVSGYQQIRLDRTCHGGGISIYVWDSVNFKPRDDIPIDGLELICIEIEPPKSKPFLVITWYQSPSDPVGSFDKLEKVLASHPRNVKRGGVGLYIKDSLPSKNRSDLVTLPECIVYEIQLNKKKYFFAVVYRSPSHDQSQFDNFTISFELMLSKMHAENPFCVIITGDFNCRSTQW